MGKLFDRLQKQLKTEYRQDAKDCIEIYNKLIELDSGHVWDSKWRLLADVRFKGFSSDERRYLPSEVGYIFLKGIGHEEKGC